MSAKTNKKEKRRSKFDGSLVEYIRRNREDKNGKVQKQKEGVLFATAYQDKIAIGFSLAHRTLDKFNYVKGKKVKDFGVNVAMQRSIKWLHKPNAIVMQNNVDGVCRTFDEKTTVGVPPSIVPTLEKFINRAVRYYKDKNLPQWAKQLTE